MKNINYKSKIRGCMTGLLFSVLCLTGCGQDEKIGLDPTDSIAPGVPIITKVEDISGGAIISFKAPTDNDLLCVMASYVINGVEQTAKASPYVNKLKVEGFGKAGTYQVVLRSVDKSKNESETIEVTINPQTPPVTLIYSSLRVLDSFGGVKLLWENATESNIIVETFKKEDDDWVSLENFYSSAKEGSATIRGLEPVSIDLKYRIRDRWDNYSEFLVKESIPLEETEFDKSKFRTVTPLPGDAPSHGSLTIDKIWDNNKVSSCYHGSGNDIDRTITFDLGQEVKLSRFKMWQRTESEAWIYSHNNLKRYIIYGCNEITTEMREGGVEIDKVMFPTFEGWTKIMDVECHKPSGDSGKITNEDKEYILGGDEHEAPVDAPTFRYIRIHMLENWTGGTTSQIGEMTFWGQIVK